MRRMRGTHTKGASFGHLCDSDSAAFFFGFFLPEWLIITCVLYYVWLCAVASGCAHFWLSGRRVEPSSISPFVWMLPAPQPQRCDYDTMSAIRFSNWAANQPDNAGDKTTVREECLAMRNINTQASNQWDDVNCEHRTCAICEYHQEDQV